MPDPLHFLRCVGRAAVKNGGRALARLLPFGEAAFEIAQDACAEYRRDHDEDRLRAEVRALVQTSPALPRPTACAGMNLPSSRFLDAPEDRPPVRVHSPTRTYTLGRLLAVGDVADVHLARAEGTPTVASEGRSILKAARAPEGNAFLDREREVLADLLAAAGDTTYRKYLPQLAESFPAEGRCRKRVHVFPHEPGLYTLEQIRDRHPALDGRHLGWIFKRLLAVLGFCHGRGTVHGAVLPCHVLIHAADHGLRLVGWGQSVAPGRRVEAISTRYRHWYPPEVLGKQPAAPATDLFLAARCLIYLAGGDPVVGRMPDAVPAAMRRFFQTCLLPGVRMRPGDAWQLLDEFDELLGRLYGLPKFHTLSMP